MDVVELKSTITKMKFSEERHNSRSEPAKDLTNFMRLHNPNSSEKEEWRKMNSLRSMWNTIKLIYICIMGVNERRG